MKDHRRSLRSKRVNDLIGNCPPYNPRFVSADGSAIDLWKQVYNMLDSKVWRLSWHAYVEQGVPYRTPEEVDDMVKLLGEIDENTSPERLRELAGYATSPGINQAIFGRT